MSSKLTDEEFKAYQAEFKVVYDEYTPRFEQESKKAPLPLGREDLGGSFNELVREYNAKIREIQERFHNR